MQSKCSATVDGTGARHAARKRSGFTARPRTRPRGGHDLLAQTCGKRVAASVGVGGASAGAPAKGGPGLLVWPVRPERPRRT